MFRSQFVFSQRNTKEIHLLALQIAELELGFSWASTAVIIDSHLAPAKS